MIKQLPDTDSRPLRLGIYGGTFDPVHLGHLILASDAREQLRLDAVLFIPCAQSPHKLGRQAASARDRLAMLRAAVRGLPHFWVSRCEIDRPAPSYAIDTATEIREAFPRAELFWLIGADQLPKLTTWERYRELRRLVTFAVLERGDGVKRLPSGVIRLPESRRVDISASEVRARAKRKLPLIPLVPAAVAAYIQRQNLYY